MTIIKKEILSEIKGSPQIIGEIAHLYKKHYSTAERWITTNNPILTTVDVIAIIKKRLEVEDILDIV